MNVRIFSGSDYIGLGEMQIGDNLFSELRQRILFIDVAREQKLIIQFFN